MHLGQVVRLNSGGPPMTVVAIKDNIVTCVWLSHEILRRANFHADCLYVTDV